MADDDRPGLCPWPTHSHTWVCGCGHAAVAASRDGILQAVIEHGRYIARERSRAARPVGRQALMPHSDVEGASR